MLTKYDVKLKIDTHKLLNLDTMQRHTFNRCFNLKLRIRTHDKQKMKYTKPKPNRSVKGIKWYL